MNPASRPVSGNTVPYAVLGHPIGHTLSPVMHQAAIEALNIDARYLAFDVAPPHLPGVMKSMHAMGFNGVNLTVPLKEVAFTSLSNLDAEAKMLGAVNTLVRTADGWRGHNTDGYGFLTALREALSIDPGGRTVFVYGTGGAGRAVALTAAVSGAARMFLADLDSSRAQRVASEIGCHAPSTTAACVAVDGPETMAAAQKSDLLIQASPLGMRPDDTPALPAAAFRSGQFLMDLVYMYPETVSMRVAADAGIKTANGLGMLLHQGALALRLWTGLEPPVKVMRTALEKAVYGHPVSVAGKQSS